MSTSTRVVIGARLNFRVNAHADARTPFVESPSVEGSFSTTPMCRFNVGRVLVLRPPIRRSNVGRVLGLSDSLALVSSTKFSGLRSRWMTPRLWQCAMVRIMV